MKKICSRAVNFIQVTDEDGAVRLCSWLRDGGVIGYLTKNSLEEIYHSEEAKLIQQMHMDGDHSNCNPNTCPYVANDSVGEIEIEIKEIPRYPESIFLAYENVCNYKCTMCGIPDCMEKADARVREEKYIKIDEELRKVLPYMKHVSANGLGELFVSKHILRLLSEWKPIATPAEITVSLETNGSLFDEVHWKQIENLGKYHLSVAVTVLSFEDDRYRKLSGTNRTIKNLIDNLKFIKGLRKREVINYLEIATVYQEQNFRGLPEFARRCIEEFGADYVRLRPFEPWGEVGMKEWMMDVRNVYHPYHKEFLEVMKDPIFSNPKVHDWGGRRESGLGPEPYIRMRGMFSIIEKTFCDETFIEKIRQTAGEKKIVVYGMTVAGKALVSRLKNENLIAYCLDRKMDGMEYLGVPIYGINHFETLDKDMTVVIVLNRGEDTIAKMLKNAGYKGNIIQISKIMGGD